MNLQKFKTMNEDEQINYDFKKTILDECVDENSIYEERIKILREKIYNEKDPITRLKEWKFCRYIIPTDEEIKRYNHYYKVDDQVVTEVKHDCDTTELSLDIMNQYMFNGNGRIRNFYRTINEEGRLDFRKELVFCEGKNRESIEIERKK